MADIEETPGQAVDSVTTVTPSPADESSSPGPYAGLDPERPPVSTTRPDVPIAQSLVAGAGEGDVNVGEPEAVQAQARAVEPETKTKKASK
jgi:hypothetical protein